MSDYLETKIPALSRPEAPRLAVTRHDRPRHALIDRFVLDDPGGRVVS